MAWTRRVSGRMGSAVNPTILHLPFPCYGLVSSLCRSPRDFITDTMQQDAEYLQLDASILAAIDDLRIKQKTAYFTLLSISKHLHPSQHAVLPLRLSHLAATQKLRQGEGGKYGLGLSVIRALGEWKRRQGLSAGATEVGWDVYKHIASMDISELECGFGMLEDKLILTSKASPGTPGTTPKMPPGTDMIGVEVVKDVESMIGILAPAARDLFVTERLLAEADEVLANERGLLLDDQTELEAAEARCLVREQRLAEIQAKLTQLEQYPSVAST